MGEPDMTILPGERVSRGTLTAKEAARRAGASVRTAQRPALDLAIP